MCGPSICAVVSKDHHVLHVTTVNAVIFGIICNWHLEQECFLWAHIGPCQLIGVNVEKERILQEATTEPSENQKILLISLEDTASLSVGEEFAVHFDYSPVGFLLMIIHLD